MVCGSEPSKNHTQCPGDKDCWCKGNRISPDGMHWCMEYLGSRLSASISCLLGCVFNGEGVYRPHTFSANQKIQACQKDCNDIFMSVSAVESVWIDTDVTLYSIAV
ncbi:hypothetical protein ACHAWO_013466 [Cyclotella atomus]|uniref:Uncharacterized protein n=1 Tax=Cyclotella atomus TaxID=382360 RepID=A0ABD3NWQ7_9STRA